MTLALRHIALLTNNPRKLVNFYTKKLDFKIEKTSLAPAEVIEPIFGIKKPGILVMLAKKSIRLEIISLKSHSFKPTACNRAGYSHWAYGVKNKESFCKHLKGVTVIKVQKAKRYIYFIKDPDANLIEIQEL